MTSNTNPNCVFCQIIANQLPAVKIYEDSETFAFLNHHPVSPGHALVIPKDHFENVYTIPPELWARMNLVAQKISTAIRSSVDADGINIVMNNESAAGQVVFHGHIHIIPRHNDDGLKHWQGTPTEPDELEKVASKIKADIS